MLKNAKRAQAFHRRRMKNLRPFLQGKLQPPAHLPCSLRRDENTYVLDIDLYNSSGEMKTARNVEVLFLNGKKELKISVPHDEATKALSSPIVHYYDVEPINMPPKTIVKYKLRNGFGWNKQGLDFLWETTQICLRYTDEKDVVRTVPIKSEKYSTYFETHMQEKQANADT